MYAEPLPSFRDVPPSERQALFVKKLHLCSFVFDFTDPNKHVMEKEIKRQNLLELVDYVNPSGGQGKFTEAVSEDVVFMISNNLFRGLPAPRQSGEMDSFDPEEEEPNLEPGWPHLQIVYEFLLRYVVSNDTDAKVRGRVGVGRVAALNAQACHSDVPANPAGSQEAHRPPFCPLSARPV